MSGLSSRLTVPVGQNGALPYPKLLWSSGQVVASGATSVASAVFDSQLDTVVELCATADCWIAVAASPTAVSAGAGCMFVSGGRVRQVYVPQSQKIAAIQAQTVGSVALIPAAAGP